jgi:hypothetical protein
MDENLKKMKKKPQNYFKNLLKKTKIRLSDKLAPNYPLPNFLFIIFEILKRKQGSPY